MLKNSTTRSDCQAETQGHELCSRKRFIPGMESAGLSRFIFCKRRGAMSDRKMLIPQRKNTRNLIAPTMRHKIASGGIKMDVTIISEIWVSVCEVFSKRSKQKRAVIKIHILNAPSANNQYPAIALISANSKAPRM